MVEPLRDDEAMELLGRAPVAHLGMIDRGRPYVVPMSFVLDGDGVMLFRTVAGRKLDAIRANPQVCVTVSEVDPMTGSWESVVAEGVADEVSDDALQTAMITLFFDKYQEILGSPLGRGEGMRPLGGLTHVIRVVIESISGVSSGRWFSAKTRPGRL